MPKRQHQNIIQIIATIAGVVALLWGSLIAFFSLVDPVAPIFFIFAVPLVLFSFMLDTKGGLIINIFTILFVISCCIAFWTTHNIQSKVALAKSSEPFNEDIFIKCSEILFEGIEVDQKKLTLQQKTDFNHCVHQE